MIRNNTVENQEKLNKFCDTRDCWLSITNVYSLLDQEQPALDCFVLEPMFYNGYLGHLFPMQGYQDYYMTKSAYIQALVNLGTTTYTAWLTLGSGDYDSWKGIQSDIGPEYNKTIPLVQKYY